MNIRNLKIFDLNFFRKENKDDEKIEIVEKEEEVDLNSNLVCEDPYILQNIGIWLQKRAQYVSNMDYNWNALSNYNDINIANLSKKEIKKIKDDFYRILLVNDDIGINEDEIITITGVTTIKENPLIKEKFDNCDESCFQEKEDTFSFNCHLKNANKDVIIRLDNYFNITVYMENMFLLGRLSSCDSSIKFHVIEKYYPDSKKNIFKSYPDDAFRLHFRNRPSFIEIELSPVEKDIEDKLESLINKTTFPINQKNLFDAIIECLDGNVTKINFNSYRYNNELKEYENNNDFIIRDGVAESVEKSLFSKNGEEKTVHLNSNGSWFFKSRKITIEYKMKNENEDKWQYSYELNDSDLDNIYNLPKLQEQFEEALNAVEEVRVLMNYYTDRLSSKAIKK